MMQVTVPRVSRSAERAESTADGLCVWAPREWCYMPINENELLELNADLMVLIREKQEQGALADAVR